MRLNRHEEGLTLVEVLFALGLIAIVVTAVYSFYLSGLQSWQKGVSRMDHQQSARIAVERIVKELRFAGWVNIEVGNREIRFKFNDDPNFAAADSYRRFYLTGGEMVQEEIRQGALYSHLKIALGITGLHFTMDESKNVHITVGAGEGSGQITMQSSVRPKNIP